jgi:hypothetical protein
MVISARAHCPAGMRILDYHIVEARYVTGHVVRLRFRDGTSGEIDLAPALRGPIFEPLRNPAVFSQFQIHPEFHTLVWPNGADFAPEFLRDNVRIHDKALPNPTHGSKKEAEL